VWPNLLLQGLEKVMEFWEDPLTWIGFAIGFLGYQCYRYLQR